MELEAVNENKSPVKPAVRSLSARWKDEMKRTLEGKPVHSFRTILRDLGTIARNRLCSPQSPDATFNLLTQPSPEQREAFKLLNVNLSP